MRRPDHPGDQRHVAETGRRVRLLVRTVGVVVRLEAVRQRFIRDARIAHAEQKLQVAREAVVGVEIVVPTVISYQVFATDRAAEPFERVVVRVGYLQVVDRRSAADRAERDAVDLLVGLEREAGELDAHVAQHARVVGVDRVAASAVIRAGTAFDLLLALIVAGAAAEDQSAPVARPTVAGSLFRREDDRLGSGPPGEDLAAPLDNQRCLSLLVAPDDGTGRNRDRRSVLDVNPAAQFVLARGVQHVVAFRCGKVLVARCLCSKPSPILPFRRIRAPFRRRPRGRTGRDFRCRCHRPNRPPVWRPRPSWPESSVFSSCR